MVIGIALVVVDSSGGRVYRGGTYRGPSRRHDSVATWVSDIRRPGDEVVVVPDGKYTVGEIKAPHPETHGPLRGWLVLVAQTRGQVVVDLADVSFVLRAGTQFA